MKKKRSDKRLSKIIGEPQGGLLYKNKPKSLDCSWSAPPIMPVFRPHNGLTVVLFFEKEPTKKKYIKKEIAIRTVCWSGVLLSFDCIYSIYQRCVFGIAQF